MSKVLIPNYDFVKNWSEDQLEEFINVPAGIPNGLMDIVQEVIPNINILRKYASFNHPEFEELDQEQSIIPRRLVRENKLNEAHEYELQYTLNFLEEYPQFKPIIKGVEDYKTSVLRKFLHI